MSVTNAALMKIGKFSSHFLPFMPSQLLSITINVTINDKEYDVYIGLFSN